ncbi:MAG: outer membrane beta-barrel protein [Thermodesulfobacteriota bacterium]|nr:outer membrane beta-barrel protein [Thermodesulfobacteriota bacterium]
MICCTFLRVFLACRNVAFILDSIFIKSWFWHIFWTKAVTKKTVYFLYLLCFFGLFMQIPPVFSDELTQIRHIQKRIEEIKARIAIFEADIEKREKENCDEVERERSVKDDHKKDKAALRKKIDDLEEKINKFKEEGKREVKEEESRFKGFYLSLGWSHAEENLDEGELDVNKGPYGFEAEFTKGSNVWGQPSVLFPLHLNDILETLKVNAAIGYKFNDKRSLELSFDYLPSFYWKERAYIFEGCDCISRAKLSIITIMASVKYSPFTVSDHIKPFIVIGSGWMYGELERQVSTLPIPDLDISFFGFELFEPLFGFGVGLWGYRGNDSMSDMCSKFGLGADIFINDNWSIGIETSFIFGEGDLDKIKYMKATAGIAYHF